MLRSYRYEPRLVTTIAAVAGIALTLALANWQLDRAGEKEAKAAQLRALSHDPPVLPGTAEWRLADVEWRRVTVRGRFVPRHAVYIDNRIRRGIAGYEVVMPLELGRPGNGSPRHVLVNRGWVAGTGDRAKLPRVRTPHETVEITGLAVTPSRRFLELSTEMAEGNVWQNLTLDRYRQAVKITIQPVLLMQESPADDGLVREWDPPDLGVDKHYGYAFQWLALALTILIFYLVTHVRRRAEAKPD